MNPIVSLRLVSNELIDFQMHTTVKALFSLLAALTLLTVSGCDSNDPPPVDTEPDEPAWDYANKGPDRWMNIDPAWAICGSGERQSPIDISVPPAADIGNWTFNYSSSRLTVHNDSKSIHLLTDGASSMTLDGDAYSLSEIHFHTTSEHTIDGNYFPGEVHFVHEGPDGKVAYVAVLIQTAEENKALTGILAEFPAEPGDPTDVLGFFYDPSIFLPSGRTFYRYDGSLTTPGCTENVTWIVMQDQLIMSSDQISALRAIMGLNFRPTQPVNGRVISQ